MEPAQSAVAKPHLRRLSSTDGESPFPLVSLSADLAVLIADSFLEPASAVALSLTCKDLKSLLFASSLQRLRLLDLEELLLLLERDSAAPYPKYYCYDCTRLHSFDPADRRPGIVLNPGATLQDTCGGRNTRFPGSRLMISYRHARLVMNQHFYGPQGGLPSSVFDVEYRAGCSDPWTQKWSAMVVDDELFLSATHTLAFTGHDLEFRTYLNQHTHQICVHVGTNKVIANHHWMDVLQRMATYTPRKAKCFSRKTRWPNSYIINITNGDECAPTVAMEPPNQRLKCSWYIPGSCGFCATDYTTTLERFNPENWHSQEQWRLTIVTYHQLGSCRSPSDPVWKAFNGTYHSHLARSQLEPRSVEDKWFSTEAHIYTRENPIFGGERPI
ncbi:hypothetical protein GGS23DRAFT_562968 [Durotheca rogersii]|uniref:uncharacterized protein n=1 Tax=Durotheca rogersii TaxID=419775 RepID=UPI00221E5435|nr:uncharacterized protein GGS23DRAFT_562968 [Durotheca rogersii]KAI5864103.1 hypothetical protein GGS23DRAFT_562968 [Durotheca rogersii]